MVVVSLVGANLHESGARAPASGERSRRRPGRPSLGALAHAGRPLARGRVRLMRPAEARAALLERVGLRRPRGRRAGVLRSGRRAGGGLGGERLRARRLVLRGAAALVLLARAAGAGVVLADLQGSGLLSMMRASRGKTREARGVFRARAPRGGRARRPRSGAATSGIKGAKGRRLPTARTRACSLGERDGRGAGLGRGGSRWAPEYDCRRGASRRGGSRRATEGAVAGLAHAALPRAGLEPAIPVAPSALVAVADR